MSYIGSGSEKWYKYLRTQFGKFLIKLKTNLSDNPSIHLLGKNLRKIKTYVYTDCIFVYECLLIHTMWMILKNLKAAKHNRVHITLLHLYEDLKQVYLVYIDKNVMAPGIGLGGCLGCGWRDYFSMLEIFCFLIWMMVACLCIHQNSLNCTF